MNSDEEFDQTELGSVKKKRSTSKGAITRLIRAVDKIEKKEENIVEIKEKLDGLPKVIEQFENVHKRYLTLLGDDGEKLKEAATYRAAILTEAEEFEAAIQMWLAEEEENPVEEHAIESLQDENIRMAKELEEINKAAEIEHQNHRLKIETERAQSELKGLKMKNQIMFEKERLNFLEEQKKLEDELKSIIMATGSNKDESKTMAANNMCDGCETYVAEKYCLECNENFCSTCAKSHLKVKYFADHKFTDIPNAEAPTSGEPIGYAKCDSHGEKNLDFLCNECSVLICTECKPGHSGHTIQDLGSNVQMYQRVCTKQIQQLLDDLHEIEDIKGILEGQINGYGDAIYEVDKWETELLKKVKDKASHLREKLKELKDERCKQLSEALAELTVKIKEVDNKVTQLNGIRKSMDSETLSQQLASAQALISNLEAYKEELKPLPTPLKISDVLPNVSKLRNIDSDLDDLFTYDEFLNSEVPSYGFIHLFKKITYPDTSSGHGSYKLCAGGISNKTVISHGSKTPDILIYDVETGDMEHKKADVEIWNMVCTAKGEYVAVDSARKKLHLLDKGFKTGDIKDASNDRNIWAVDVLTPRRFLALEMTTTKPFTAFITQLITSNGQMAIEKEISVHIDDPKIHYMAIHQDRRNVTLCSYSHLYKVDLSTTKFIKHDITNYAKHDIWSFTVDSTGNALIGNNAGEIHMFDKLYSHTRLINIEGYPRGMLVKQRQIYITSTKNGFFIYK